MIDHPAKRVIYVLTEKIAHRQACSWLGMEFLAIHPDKEMQTKADVEALGYEFAKMTPEIYTDALVKEFAKRLGKVER